MNGGNKNKEEIKLRIAELSEIIESHNYNYYVLAQPTISDYDFDMLLKELIVLEQQYPDLILSTSPTQRVGGDITKEFQTVRHRYPMLSLSNSYNIEEVKDFINRIKKTIDDDVEFVCELKFDGISISLTYENGAFVKAVTRGDGTQGDDVTTNVKTIRSIPLRLKGNYPDFFEMRGEIIMPHSSFNSINIEREDLGLQPFANPRNAAAGTIKLQDSKEVLCEFAVTRRQCAVEVVRKDLLLCADVDRRSTENKSRVQRVLYRRAVCCGSLCCARDHLDRINILCGFANNGRCERGCRRAADRGRFLRGKDLRSCNRAVGVDCTHHDHVGRISCGGEFYDATAV